ncbi:immunoglobulin kappa light chain-like [Hoplias malabaricus]|uniref:immunoglobulin kappa light chain-like n=1 Tax=Hoplias malabaricus TaxID=27720 RepID=UPI003462DE9A
MANPLKAQKGSQQDGALILLEEGQNVTIVCPYQSDMAMHFSWYRHIIGHKPELISTIYKYESKATFYHEFKNNPRFNMVNGKGITYLNISKLQISDSATYYCGSAHSNIVEFGDGTELVVRASHVHILQQPTVQLVKSGDSVILQCTVLTGSISGDHSVYWLKHGSGESPPGIIYAHGDTNSQCSRSSETDSPTQSCVYKLPKTNLSLSDAGTYYCAVAVCGQILFGNGTKLNLDNKGSATEKATCSLRMTKGSGETRMDLSLTRRQISDDGESPQRLSEHHQLRLSGCRVSGQEGKE